MTRVHLFFLLFVSLFAARLCAQTQPDDLPPVTMAIIGFTASDESPEGTVDLLAGLLTAELAAKDNILLVERLEMNRIAAELELQEAALISPESALQAGQLCGAQIIIFGHVRDAGQRRSIVIKAISCETRQIVGRSLRTTIVEPPGDLMTTTADLLVAAIRQNHAKLFPTTVDFSQRLERHVPPSKQAKLPTFQLTTGEPGPPTTPLLQALIDTLPHRQTPEFQLNYTLTTSPLDQIRGRSAISSTATLTATPPTGKSTTSTATRMHIDEDSAKATAAAQTAATEAALSVLLTDLAKAR